MRLAPPQQEENCMEPVYVVGHQNPDTDSIVSAMAYASLRNALGDRNYIAARLGEPSDQTQLVLDRFGFEAPQRLYTLRTQVSDLEFDTPPILSAAVSVGHAWQTAAEGNAHVIGLPVTDEEGRLFGMLTMGDIAEYDLRTLDGPAQKGIPLFNLLRMLDGQLLNDNGANALDCGGVAIALPGEVNRQESLQGMALICGDQPEALQRAAEQGAACVVVCRAHPDEQALAALRDICVIYTPLDAYQASRRLYQSIPVSRICQRENLVSFHLSDYLDNVREITLQSRYRSYPILDDQERVVGTLSRYHLLRPRRKRVVLVDHNEIAQSVYGLEQAEILEIIDHHRLADVQTGSPIYFRNEPVGSTATIIAGMYQENGVTPSPKMAGLMAAAILADTVMFKSPTCTERDVRMARRLERMAGISLNELGQALFSISANTAQDAKTLLFSDFKEFHIGGHSLGIGQVTCLDSHEVLTRADELLGCMRAAMDECGYHMILLMLTDVLRNGTELLVLGDHKIIKQAFDAEVENDRVFLPGVLSRKKQIVPSLSLLWG